MITTGYIHGAALRMPDWPDNEAVRMLEGSRADHPHCGDYSHTEAHIVIMCAGSYGGDILDESNAATLETMVHAWIDDERNDDDSIDRHYGRGDYISVCVNPETIDPELLGEMIEVAEGFADYPVLDDDDNSRREWEAWNEALEWELRDYPESARATIAEWVTENYMGYSEPGYVCDTWVTEAAVATGLTRAHRRVRTLAYSTGGYGSDVAPNIYRYRVQVMHLDGDGDDDYRFSDLFSIGMGTHGPMIERH